MSKTGQVPGQPLPKGDSSAFLPAPLPPALEWAPRAGAANQLPMDRAIDARTCRLGEAVLVAQVSHKKVRFSRAKA